MLLPLLLCTHPLDAHKFEMKREQEDLACPQTFPQWVCTPRPRLLRSETPLHRHTGREALMEDTAYNTGRHELGTKSQPERGADTSQR